MVSGSFVGGGWSLDEQAPCGVHLDEFHSNLDIPNQENWFPQNGDIKKRRELPSLCGCRLINQPGCRGLVRQVQCVITLSNEESPKDMADFLECAGVAPERGLSLTDEHLWHPQPTRWVGLVRKGGTIYRIDHLIAILCVGNWWSTTWFTWSCGLTGAAPEDEFPLDLTHLGFQLQVLLDLCLNGSKHWRLILSSWRWFQIANFGVPHISGQTRVVGTIFSTSWPMASASLLHLRTLQCRDAQTLAGWSRHVADAADCHFLVRTWWQAWLHDDLLANWFVCC